MSDPIDGFMSPSEKEASKIRDLFVCLFSFLALMVPAKCLLRLPLRPRHESYLPAPPLSNIPDSDQIYVGIYLGK